MNSLVGPGVAAPFVGASSLTATQAASIGNGGGAGPVKTITGDYAMPLSENGYTYTNTGAGADYVVSLPVNAPEGFTVTVFCNSGGGNIGIAVTSPMYLQPSSGAFNVGFIQQKTSALGGCITYKRADSGNAWLSINSSGSVAAPTT